MNVVKLRKEMKECRACSLYNSGKLVEARFGKNAKLGNIKLLVIGEAPGKEEAEAGVPFIGYLKPMMDEWLRRICPSEKFVIVNVMKHRPTNPDDSNRTPSKKEIRTCFPFLDAQIEFYKPEKIFCVGDVAFSAVTKENSRELEGAVENKKTYSYKGIECYVYYHPGYIFPRTDFNWESRIDELGIEIRGE